MYLRCRKKKVSFPYIYNYCIYLPDSVSVSEHLNTLFVKTVRDIGRKFGEGTWKKKTHVHLIDERLQLQDSGLRGSVRLEGFKCNQYGSCLQD